MDQRKCQAVQYYRTYLASFVQFVRVSSSNVVFLYSTHFTMETTQKRGIEYDLASDKRQKHEKEADFRNNYSGFSLQREVNDIKPEILVEQATIQSKTLFEQYISKRRPCVMEGLPPLVNGKPLEISTKDLLDINATVQVEKRLSKDQPFGQNRTTALQVEMSIQDFVQQLETNSGEYLYLTTQDTGEDTPFQNPCKELLKNGMIDATLPFSGNLILHSVNLWLGKSQNGASSGLHHDYHDNFYLLLKGKKSFRMYSPDTAPYMYTHGEIDCIHENGRISYVGSEARADGAPLDSDDDDDDDESDEDEVVLGKGFDYKDEDDEGDENEFGENDEKDDFDDIMDKEESSRGENQQKPESFSRINLGSSTDDKCFPLFKNCREVTVELNAGQCIYVPAGWFHEVTSFGKEGDKTKTHMALNYWYHPPDAEDFAYPYKDDFWKKQGQLN